MKDLLLDTGPLVAFLDPNDPAHSKSRIILSSFRGQLWTTCAVIAETMYFVGGHPLGPKTVAEFVDASRIRIEECTNLKALKQAAALIEKYAGTPMDFADATLILLSNMRNTTQICTLDRRGFSTYRSLDKKRFVIVP
jgi:uncharacterized protein